MNFDTDHANLHSIGHPYRGSELCVSCSVDEERAGIDSQRHFGSQHVPMSSAELPYLVPERNRTSFGSKGQESWPATSFNGCAATRQLTKGFGE